MVCRTNRQRIVQKKDSAENPDSAGKLEGSAFSQQRFGRV